MSSVRKPSLFRILTTDYASFLSLVTPPVCWGLWGLLNLLWRGDPASGAALDALFRVSLAATALLLPLLGWRVRTVWATLQKGEEITGRIEVLYFFRDRGRVVYSYSYRG